MELAFDDVTLARQNSGTPLKQMALVWGNLMGNPYLSPLTKIVRLRFKFDVVRPPRIELGPRVPETLVISFSLRAQ